MSKYYRCPYCGEPVFSLRVKLRIVSKFGTAPWCWECKRVVFRHVGGGHIRYDLMLLMLAIVVTGCFCGSIYWQQPFLIPVWILLVVMGYLLFNYYFCYFDKCYRREKEADPRFHFTSTCTDRLWPTVREGEIYELYFPGKNKGDIRPRVIAMVQEVEGKPGDRRFTMRVIRLDDMDLPVPGDPLRLVTDGMLVVEGTVTE